MAKTFRYDPDSDDSFDSRDSMRKQRKLVKEKRRNKTREEDRMDGGESKENRPYNVMDTVDLSWSE